MTHLLVPLEALEKLKADLHILFKDQADLFLRLLSNIESKGKEISLTEVDIEAKAIESVKKTTAYGSLEAPIGSSARSYFETEANGYRQALTDLL